MSVIYIYPVRYICRLDTDGSTVLNPYIPISFSWSIPKVIPSVLLGITTLFYNYVVALISENQQMLCVASPREFNHLHQWKELFHTFSFYIFFVPTGILRPLQKQNRACS